MPNVTFSEEAEIDLGDFPVRLLHWGPSHTRGDEFVFLPKQSIVFGGDVVVNRFFPIMADSDSSGTNWIEILEPPGETASRHRGARSRRSWGRRPDHGDA